MKKEANELTTARLVLRHWSEADAPALFSLAADPAIGLAAGWSPHRSEAESREVIRTVFAAPEVYAVTMRGNGEAVGCAGLTPAAGADGSLTAGGEAVLGYWTGRSHWGRGIATEAAGALLRHAFTTLGLRAVWCAHYDGNAASRRVMEKCGFGYHHSTPDTATPLGDLRTEHHWLLTADGFLRRHGMAEDIPSVVSLCEISRKERCGAFTAEAVSLWEESVRASHHFLTEADIAALRPYVAEAVGAIDTLLAARADGRLAGFIGVQDRKIEMLFVAPRLFGRGIGTMLAGEAITRLGAVLVDVNEQNPAAADFYRRLGFSVFSRDATDGQGRPFPILHLRMGRQE